MPRACFCSTHNTHQHRLQPTERKRVLQHPTEGKRRHRIKIGGRGAADLTALMLYVWEDLPPVLLHLTCQHCCPSQQTDRAMSVTRHGSERGRQTQESLALRCVDALVRACACGCSDSGGSRTGFELSARSRRAPFQTRVARAPSRRRPRSAPPPLAQAALLARPPAHAPLVNTTHLTPTFIQRGPQHLSASPPSSPSNTHRPQPRLTPRAVAGWEGWKSSDARALLRPLAVPGLLPGYLERGSLLCSWLS